MDKLGPTALNFGWIFGLQQHSVITTLFGTACILRIVWHTLIISLMSSSEIFKPRLLTTCLQEYYFSYFHFFILKELPKLPGIIILWLSIVLHRSLDTCALPVCMRVNVTVSYSISLWFLVPEFVLFLSFLLFFPHLISLWLIVPVFFLFTHFSFCSITWSHCVFFVLELFLFLSVLLFFLTWSHACKNIIFLTFSFFLF